MDTQGNIIVWGSLSILTAMIVVGFCIEAGAVAYLLRIFGILGMLAWIGFALYLANAMNTDI